MGIEFLWEVSSMDAEKRQRYENISSELVRLSGGRNNILGIAHCATRLRLVLEDNDKADIKAIEDVDLVKGVFVAGDQLQLLGLLAQHAAAGRRHTCGGAVEAVAANLVLLIVFIGQGVHIGLGGHRLVEGGVEHGHLGHVLAHDGRCRRDAGDVGGVVEGGQGDGTPPGPS